MTDAQKALDDAELVTCLGHLTNFAHNHSEAIMKALRLLAAVEAGEWKAVPVEPDECMVYAADLAQEPFCDVDVYPTRDLLKAAIRAAIYAAPDFFAEDGK